MICLKDWIQLFVFRYFSLALLFNWKWTSWQGRNLLTQCIHMTNFVCLTNKIMIWWCSEEIAFGNCAWAVLLHHVILCVLHSPVHHNTHWVREWWVAKFIETKREVTWDASSFVCDITQEKNFWVSLLDLFLVDLDGSVIGKTELIKPDGVWAVPIL